MIITNLALSLIFVCCLMIVVGGALSRIEVSEWIKGVLCLTMISIIGVWTGKFHPYSDTAIDAFYIFIAYLVARRTYFSYQRGYF